MQKIQPEDLKHARTLKVSQNTVSRTVPGPEIFEEILQEVQRKVIGQHELFHALFLGLLTGGHLLIEGEPGTGKSSAVRALAETLELNTTHVMTEADLVGTNLVLIEELDRTLPEFRRNLMAAMQEGETIFQGERIYLLKPFLVFASINPGQNQIALSQAERERFLLSHTMNPPSSHELREIFRLHSIPASFRLEKILSQSDLLEMQRLVKQISLSRHAEEHLIQKIEAIQPSLSVRSALALLHTSQAQAYLENCPEVLPEHIEAIQTLVLRHRIEA